MSENYKLCYVEDNFAYFTTKELKDQWGDDWNDAPYEHNAGEPYEPCWHNTPEQIEKNDGKCECGCCVRDWNEDGTPKWKVMKVAYDGCFDTPSSNCANSNFSVEDINAGAVPWLSNKWDKVFINAGVSFEEFKSLVKKGGGNVYVAV